jgi:N-acetylglutamate synthase-like GNAT family acetyltransferase
MNTCLADRPRSAKTTAAGRRRGNARRFVAGHDYMWVCSIGGRIVGVVRLRHDGPDVARLSQFHVDPEWQHTSVPRKLICCVRTHFRHAGLSRIVVEPRVAPRWLLRSLRYREFQFASGGAVVRQVSNFAEP